MAGEEARAKAKAKRDRKANGKPQSMRPDPRDRRPAPRQNHGRSVYNPPNVSLVGRRVEFRAKGGGGEGDVLEVMDRNTAEMHVGRKLSRGGAWLFVTGHPDPISRRRVKLLPERGKR